jgi:hypothetical protein
VTIFKLIELSYKEILQVVLPMEVAPRQFCEMLTTTSSPMLLALLFMELLLSMPLLFVSKQLAAEAHVKVIRVAF